MRIFYSRIAWLLVVLCTYCADLSAQVTETFPPNSFIINMGVQPQTVANGLRPYGMIYDLVKNFNVPVYWIINPTKAKDGIDFSFQGTDFRGSAFIIPAAFRTPAVNARITFWTNSGVRGINTNSPLILDTSLIFNVIKAAPVWTLDKKNGSIAAGYFVNAGIPASAHGGSSSNWKDPAELTCCDDLFAMPHADPVWGTHARLFTWNLECKGGIWAACHAMSALENMVNPSNRSIQTNFLTVKDPNWTGNSGSYTLSNAAVLWGSHDDGSIPYTYRLPTDPIAQFIGVIDAATQNGSEQIYLPRQGIVANPSTYSPAAVARWNPGAKIIAYDPTFSNVTNPDLVNFSNVGTVMLYGRGFDDPNRGFVMYEAAHSHNKETAPANIAAQRAFFNLGLIVASEKAPVVDISSIPSAFATGSSQVLNISVTGDYGPYTVSWSSTCGGSFSPNNTISTSTTFTAPIVQTSTPCIINVAVSDACGRTFNESKTVVVESCILQFNNTVTNVACNGQSNGIIQMSITGSGGPFSYSWTRVSPAGSGSGTGTTISGLSVGTYTVSVNDGTGCQGSFTQAITQPNPLTATPSITNNVCDTTSGAINLSVSGGTTPRSFSWTGPNGFAAATRDIANLAPGQYNLTITDANNCTFSNSYNITGPANPLGVSLIAKADVSCFAAADGSIQIAVTGGTLAYTYAWADGPTTQNRSNLGPGTYTVTVTDASNCKATINVTITQPPALSVSLNKTDPTCPPGSDPPTNSDGAITLTASGGVPGYTYLWSTLNGSGLVPTDKDQSGLTAGTYNVVVEDSTGCTASTSIVLQNLFPAPAAPTSIGN